MTTLEESRTYLVTFDRISRDHHVAPQTYTARDADELAAQIHAFARSKMASRHVEVVVDLEEMNGNIFAGFQVGGSFTIRAL